MIHSSYLVPQRYLFTIVGDPELTSRHVDLTVSTASTASIVGIVLTLGTIHGLIPGPVHSVATALVGILGTVVSTQDSTLESDSTPGTEALVPGQLAAAVTTAHQLGVVEIRSTT